MLELHCLASNCRFLTNTATATLVSVYVDYNNSLLHGSTHDTTICLQRIQNNAARVLLRLSRSANIAIHLNRLINKQTKHTLESFKWLGVKVRSTYKTAMFCCDCHSITTPLHVTYLYLLLFCQELTTVTHCCLVLQMM